MRLAVWGAFGANFEVAVLKLYEELEHEQGINSQGLARSIVCSMDSLLTRWCGLELGV